jgi:hypothetical protein
MNDMTKLKDMLCEELDKLTKRGEISSTSLDSIHKLVVTIEKIDRIEEMEGGEDYSGTDWEARGNYSRARYGRSYGDSYGDDSYRNDSYARRGQHYVRGHYSRASEDMGQKIEELMNDNGTPSRDKETLRKAMEILGR